MAERFPDFESLTSREADVLACLVEDLSNNEIANRLFLSVSTVKWYVRQLNSKLNASNRREIVDRARALGILAPSPPKDHGLKRNLPVQLTPFVGRDTEMDEIAQILDRPDCRLITILAPGGMGKTRLALEIAEKQFHRFGHGAYFIPLQPLTDIEQIIPAIAQQLGFFFTTDARPPKQQLLDYLAEKEMLLVIDNWEHLLDGALFVAELLQAAPGVRVLATSRERLNLSGETIYGLRGMQYPTWETPQDAWQYDAVKLLAQAARRVQPDFDLAADNLDFVARICRLTEGMPLGILLAVSWLDTLSLERIADEIVRSLDFLETEMRDVSERHRSLRAILEAAWARLKPDEQNVFMILSVFRGGFMLDAAEAVASATLRTMQALVNKAFLVRTRTGRYDVHELLRQYGYSRLSARGQLVDALRRHSVYFAKFLKTRENDLKAGHQLKALDDIATELGNIRQGWQQALQDEQIDLIEQSLFSFRMYLNVRSRQLEFMSLFADAERVLRPRYAAHLSYSKLLISYGSILFRFGRFQEIEALVRPAIAVARAIDDPLTIASGCALLALSVIWLDTRDEVWALCDEALGIFEQFGDRFELANALVAKSYICGVYGKYDETLSLCRRALEIQRRGGDEIGMAQTLHNIAVAADFAGQLDEFEARVREALELRKRFNLPEGIARSLRELGGIEFQKGNVDAARNFVDESLRVARDIAHPQEIATSLLYLAAIDVVSGRFDDAEQEIKEVMKLQTAETYALYLLIKSLIRLGLGDLIGAENAARDCLKQRTGDDPIGQTPMAMLAVGLTLGHGRPESGLELASLALNNPRMQKSLANSLLVTSHLEAIKNQLSQAAYAEAWERGKVRDMQATVSELLKSHGDGRSELD